MAVVINGSGTVTGLAVGGLPDGTVDAGTLATDSVTAVKLPDTVEADLKSGRKNLIINGAMQVAQGGTSATSVSEASDGFNKRTVDRFRTLLGGALHTAVYTVSQDSNAPTGFSNSYKVSCTTADASLDASVNSYIDYRIEAQDLQHLDYGTSNAKTLTLSFWVKSNQTGDYVSWQYTQDAARHRGTVYTINTSDTWEKKTITFSGDTSQGITNDSGIGMMVRFVFAAGTNFTSGTLPSEWANLASAHRHPGQTANIGSSTSDYFQITGVQLEVGSQATDFEHRSYGEELALCQRYYYSHADASGQCVGTVGFARYSNQIRTAIIFPVTMRSSPSLSAGSGTNYYKFEHSTNTIYATTLGLTNTNNKATEIYASVSGATQGDARTFALASGAAYVSFDSEL